MTDNGQNSAITLISKVFATPQAIGLNYFQIAGRCLSGNGGIFTTAQKVWIPGDPDANARRGVVRDPGSEPRCIARSRRFCSGLPHQVAANPSHSCGSCAGAASGRVDWPAECLFTLLTHNIERRAELNFHRASLVAALPAGAPAASLARIPSTFFSGPRCRRALQQRDWPLVQ